MFRACLSGCHLLSIFVLARTLVITKSGLESLFDFEFDEVGLLEWAVAACAASASFCDLSSFSCASILQLEIIISVISVNVCC